MRTVALCLVLLGTAHAGWQRDCRVQARQCRMDHGTSTTTSTTSSTTTTTLTPLFGYDSENCNVACLRRNGAVYCLTPAVFGCQPPPPPDVLPIPASDCVLVTGFAGVPGGVYCPR